MRRQVAILTILALIFLTVTGITVAQERTSDPQKGDRQGATVKEAKTNKSSAKTNENKGSAEKSETTATKKSTKDPDKGLAGNNEATKQTRAQNSDNNPETTKRKAAESKTAQGKSEEASETEDADKPADKGRPASADKSSGNGGNAKGVDNPTNAGGKPDSVDKPASTPAAVVVGKAGSVDKAKGKANGKGEAEGGSAEGKVIVCHKGKKTLSVGAPARAAHLRHGDTDGPCSQ